MKKGEKEVSKDVSTWAKSSLVREVYRLRGTIERMCEALELMVSDYRSDGCSVPNCKVCARSKAAMQKALVALSERG